MSAPVLVTGSTGFIGAAVTAALRHAGKVVRAGSRQARSPHTIACDLDDPALVSAAVTGAGTVVHCAYGVESAMPRQCATLLAAMSNAGVDVLVYFSSIAVCNEPPDTYARAKMECESLVRAWEAGKPARRAIILRPGIVYGKGSHFWIDKPVERIRAGVWGDFGYRTDGTAPLVHVDDVAQAVNAALDFAGTDRQTSWPLPAMDVIGPETPSWNSYFQAIATATGAGNLPRIGAPGFALRSALALPAKVLKRAGLPGFNRYALFPGRGEMQLYGRKTGFDRSNIALIPGALPQTGLTQGLARTFSQKVDSPASHNLPGKY